MTTSIYTLASGSSGNALLLFSGSGCFLVDAGISCRRITEGLSRLSTLPARLDGIFVTHTHSDHISGLKTLLKRTDCPVLAGREVCSELSRRLPEIGDRLSPLPLCDGWPAKDCVVTAFPTSHDSPGSCGFRFDTPCGAFGLLTDTGYVTDEAREILPGVNAVLLEANHDADLLWSGPYPEPLKERVAGRKGHLSNEDAAEFAVTLAEAGAETIVLAHLSGQNNTPRRAKAAVLQALTAANCHAALSVAPPDTLFRVAELRARAGRRRE